MMEKPETRRLQVGGAGDARDIAVLHRAGTSPGLFWLGGFRSDMTGQKAEALDALGAETGREVTRFDYSGHGQSGGDFLDGTISRWLEEARAVFETTSGPQILVGSSMGGWLALLLNKALRDKGAERVHGMVLVAPAVDMTEELMRAGFSPAELHDLHMKGRVEQPSRYSDQPYVITEKLITDGARHLLFDKGSIVTSCPVHILQGGRDPDVPAAHALRLVSHLTQDPVRFTLIPDGDHRLSRDQDILKLRHAIEEMLAAEE